MLTKFVLEVDVVSNMQIKKKRYIYTEKTRGRIRLDLMLYFQ